MEDKTKKKIVKKCGICGVEFKDGEETVPFKSKMVHLNCFNIGVKVIGEQKQEELNEKAEAKKTRKKTAKPKMELKDGMSEDEYKEKQDLYAYIRKVLEEDEIPSNIYAMSQKIMTKYGYSFTEMKDTLVYANEIKGKELTGDIVGIIPYLYTEAQRYYEEIKNIEKNNNGKDVDKFYKEKVIKIRPKKRVPKQLNFEDEES